MDKYIGLEKIISSQNIKYNESMKKHTTMKVGGNADCLVSLDSIEEIVNVLKYSKENDIKTYVIGNGSNLLVRDGGIRGLVIKLKDRFSSYEVKNDEIVACSGLGMPALSQIAKKNSLSGLEFACGIPGTIGGGVRMNAGAYGSEMSNVVEEVTYLDENLNVKTISKNDIDFSYRHSIFSDNTSFVILSTKFRLIKDDIEKITEKMKQNRTARIEKQPLDLPNFGSVFRRPEGYFVGKLVSDAGLRGAKIGGAQVSEKHTGFIVNTGNATCKDVLDVIKLVQDTVYEKFGVKLQTEVEIIGGEN